MSIYTTQPKKVDVPPVTGPTPDVSEVIDNHVYFYAEITQASVMKLIKGLRDTQSSLIWEGQQREGGLVPPIWLHINSEGGDVFSSFAAADTITASHVPVWSLVEGMAASGASILSMSCARRIIMPSAFILIHQASTFPGWITNEQLKDEAHIMDLISHRMIDFYAAHSKMTKKEVKKMLKHDSWFNAQEALDLGFVDSIYPNF